MTGLEKIINKIEHDSANKCGDIIAAAKKHAEEIEKQAAIEGETITAGLDETARHQAKEIILKAHSGAAQKAKQVILNARVEAINETLASAANAIKQMPEEEYFKSLIALAANNAAQNQGEMRLSLSDLNRLPPEFEKDLNNALKNKEITVKVSEKPADIGHGFILVYGDVEINCTFDALMEASRDELKEVICGIIF